jgi:hypothetical protein
MTKTSSNYMKQREKDPKTIEIYILGQKYAASWEAVNWMLLDAHAVQN